jgi:hypothetical protein
MAKTLHRRVSTRRLRRRESISSKDSTDVITVGSLAL